MVVNYRGASSWPFNILSAFWSAVLIGNPPRRDFGWRGLEAEQRDGATNHSARHCGYRMLAWNELAAAAAAAVAVAAARDGSRSPSEASGDPWFVCLRVNGSADGTGEWSYARGQLC